MRNKFIEGSLIKTLDFIRDSIFTEEYSQPGGLMQALDPRVKLLSLLAILTVIAFTKSITLLFILYAASIFLAYLSRINLAFFLKRVWVFIPLFSLLIGLPALFNFFSPGEKIFLSITRQGLWAATTFFLRVLTSVSFSILFMVTTSHILLLCALRSLGIPQIFVTTFTMSYRYIYIFIKVVEDTYLAIKSRLIDNIRHRRAHKIIAWRIGTLWEKSLGMSEEVYLAMLARGYSGEPKGAVKFHLRPVDFWWIIFVILIASTIFYFNGRTII